jgi:hypothetical protein
MAGDVDRYTPMAYNEYVKIIIEFSETPIFTSQITEAISDEDYRSLQSELIKNPCLGKKIPSSGGLRKIRWGMEGHGKSKGLRIIYFWKESRQIILMLFVYPKNVQTNLTHDQVIRLHKIVEATYGR